MTNYSIGGKFESYTPDSFITTSGQDKNVNFNDIHGSLIIICSSNSENTPNYLWIEYKDVFTVSDFLSIDLKGVKPVGFYVIECSKELGNKIADDVKENNEHFNPL